jgi:hypothetical protein
MPESLFARLSELKNSDIFVQQIFLQFSLSDKVMMRHTCNLLPMHLDSEHMRLEFICEGRNVIYVPSCQRRVRLVLLLVSKTSAARGNRPHSRTKPEPADVGRQTDIPLCEVLIADFTPCKLLFSKSTTVTLFDAHAMDPAAIVHPAQPRNMVGKGLRLLLALRMKVLCLAWHIICLTQMPFPFFTLFFCKLYF